MKITILGGLGYIGSHLTSSLVLSKKHNISILDCCFFGTEHLQDILEENNCSFVKGDIRNADDLAKIIKGSDIVIHLAGLVGDPACSLDEETTWLHNLQSTNMIVDICNYYDVKKLIYASSCSVYGAGPLDVILNEGSYMNPVSLYAKTKLESEKIIFRKFNNIASVVRLATVFGFSKRMRFDLVINLFTIKAIKEGKIQVYGGHQFRPFIHCIDAARAFETLALFQNDKYIDRECFNISAENISIKDLGSLVSELLNCETEFVDIKEDDRNYKVSSKKASWMLNFRPRYNLDMGILEMAEQLKGGFDDWKENSWKYSNCDNLARRNSE